MDLQKNIRERCHVNKNDEGDSFVGVKADTDDAVIYFPIGYQLPPNDDDLRADINNLFYVLAAFMKEDKLIEESKFAAPRTVDFPMHAYLKVIRDFLRTGRYYIETDPRFKTDTKGNASWPRTVREQRALVQKNGSLIFTNMTVRSVTPNADKKITQIQQELFSAMVSMLKYMDEKSSDKQYFFGTDFFERIWEKMIDKAFGIEDKDRYFPRTRWLLDYGPNRSKTPLQPDTIMIYNGKVYVLDAKLYRYGYSGNPDHLPNGPDINKQITYGEYIERAKGVPSEILYNAFIMPFNREDNTFFEMGADGNPIPRVTDNIGNIGEAVGDWKPEPKNYERVQGIVIDTRFLMYNYIGMPDQQKRQLAEAIEKVETRAPVPRPAT